MSKRLIEPLIILFIASLYLLIDISWVQYALLFLLLTLLIKRFIYFLFKDAKGSTFQIILHSLLFILLFAVFTYSPFSGQRTLNQHEYIKYLQTSTGIKKLPEALTLYEEDENTIVKLKLDNQFTIKKTYTSPLKVNHYLVEVLNIENYPTGNYILYIKNNITNEAQKYVVSNNGDLKIGSDITLNMLNHKANYKGLGEAIQIHYSMPQAPLRKHKQWLYKDYQEFNLLTSSDDPLTIVFMKEETKKRYQVQVAYQFPHYNTIKIFILLLLLLSFAMSLIEKASKTKENLSKENLSKEGLNEETEKKTEENIQG